MLVEYVTVAAYLIVLVVTGLLFSRLSTHTGDYIRAGGQGVWWMVGTSMLMSGISAFTFTGNGSAAYSAGPTFLVIYVANVLGYIVAGWFLAGWLRQTRAHTSMDIVRSRFGTATEQFALVAGVILQPMRAAIQLWALGVFASTAFGFPLQETIVILGAIVVFYSTTGGKWAVLATDFVQGVVLFPITVLLAVLALREIGGFGEFFGYFNKPEFAADFSLVKEPTQFPEGRFSMKWIVAIFIMQFYAQIGINESGRYLSTKDGREARRAAWLACVLMAVGSVVWFIPPMVARFLFHAEIDAMDVKNPAESAYVFLSRRLLPSGLMGVMIAAMFSATMSSMDTGLNDQAGIIIRNFVARIREFLGRAPLTNRVEMAVCRVTTIVLGLLVITVSLLLSAQENFPLFDAYLILASTIGIPIGFPMLAGLWLRRLPGWSYFAIFLGCLAPSLYALYDAKANGAVWTIQDRSIAIFVCGLLATLACLPFNRLSPARHRNRETEFFRTMLTPVDFEKETGGNRDHQQLQLLGNVTLVMSGLVALLMLLPNPVSGRLLIGAIAASTGTVGLLLRLGARRARKD